MKKTNKKKFFIIFLIIICIIALAIISILVKKNKPKTSLSDFSSIKEIVEYDGHTYISMENSKEDGFDKDIYISFSKSPVNEDGTTNQKLYEIVISHVAGMLKGENFRLIDVDKNVVVKIKFNDNDEVSTYTINDDLKYWEHIKTNYQIGNSKEEQLSNFTITSTILEDIINNNWNYNNISLGTRESIVDNYEIFFDEGYKVRKIGSEIYNIVFTQNYNGKILNGITSTTSLENVENILGNPTLKDDINNIIGYKSNYFYIFFTGDEASIYPSDKYDEQKSKKFGELITELNKTGDMKTFLNKLTDLYPDYILYNTDENNNYVDIIYPLEGFEVVMGDNKNNGITLYGNFKGYITDSITIDDLKQNKKVPANVYTKLDKNLVFEMGVKQLAKDSFVRNPYDKAYLVQTKEYTVLKQNNTYTFYSRDKSKIDSTLKINNLTKILSYDDTTFIYGIKNDGIYVYNAETLESRRIVEGEKNFNIERIENNTIYYDDTFVNLGED